MSDRWLLLLNAATTLYMTGLIWFVQVVHYPLFAKVGVDRFAAYERSHSQLTTWVVVIPMLVELATAGLLLLARPVDVSLIEAWLGAALVIAIWISTWLLQVPQHAKLELGFDASVHRSLVLGNWIRTILWSGRAVLVMVWLSRRL